MRRDRGEVEEKKVRQGQERKGKKVEKKKKDNPVQDISHNQYR